MSNFSRKISSYSFLFLCIFLMSCGGAYKTAIRNYDGSKHPPTESCSVKVFHTKYWFDKFMNEEFNSKRYTLVGSSDWTSKTGFVEKHATKLCKKLGGDFAILFDYGVKYIDNQNVSFTTYSQQTATSYYSNNTSYYNNKNRYVGNANTTGNIYTSYWQPNNHQFTVSTSYSSYSILIFKEKRVIR